MQQLCILPRLQSRLGERVVSYARAFAWSSLPAVMTFKTYQSRHFNFQETFKDILI